jgi:hypothetical protein
MDLDPTSGRLGTGRTATALATETRRAVTPPEVEREAVSRTAERATYTSPGLRPPGDVTRDVVVQLSQKALALARSASTKPPLTKSVDGESESDAPAVRRGSGREDGPADASASRINVRA